MTTLNTRRRPHRRLAAVSVAFGIGVGLAASAAANATSVPDDGLPAFGTPERCEANRAAGTMTFMTGYDYAADAGILDVVAAEQQGFYDDMCLDVEVQPGLSPANSAALASGTVQLADAPSFGEMVNQNVNGGADLMGFGQLGHTSITSLLVPADSPVQELTDLEGKTIGIKGDIPFPVLAMLEEAGLKRGTYTELLLDGFDPVEHFALGIDALPVYKSNEPALLDDAGFAYREFDPLDYDIPASFAIYMSTRSFYEEHPTAIEDFVRASLMGYHYAAENPEEAVAGAFELIDAAGNQFFLAQDHELDRWSVETQLIEEVTPADMVIGQMDVDQLGAEVQTLTDLGVFDTLPDWESMLDASIVPKLYEGDELIWESMS
jgi:ABC-type nitrate/sulfonate/bicarbonate transport system substrate-binding protein